MTNETIATLKSRRSCKDFLPEQIKDEELEAVLEAGKYAPTGRGLQSPIMIAVQDPETVKKLSKMNAAVLGTDSDPSTERPRRLWCSRKRTPTPACTTDRSF